ANAGSQGGATHVAVLEHIRKGHELEKAMTEPVWAKKPHEDPYMTEGRFGNPPAKTCCNQCPLRRDSTPGYLGGYTAEEYITILHGDADIACHMSKGFKERALEEQRSCTGVAIYRRNACKIPRGTNAIEAM